MNSISRAYIYRGGGWPREIEIEREKDGKAIVATARKDEGMYMYI